MLLAAIREVIPAEDTRPANGPVQLHEEVEWHVHEPVFRRVAQGMDAIHNEPARTSQLELPPVPSPLQMPPQRFAPWFLYGVQYAAQAPVVRLRHECPVRVAPSPPVPSKWVGRERRFLVLPTPEIVVTYKRSPLDR